MLIRQMLATDISTILAIEQLVQASPWSRKMFEGSLHHQDLGWVLVDENELRGYVLVKPVGRAELANPNTQDVLLSCVAQSNLMTEADILTIAVDKNHQRQGYGQALLIFLRTQFDCLYLEVRVSNKPAIALYEKVGFKTIGTRPKYYQGEDALVMQLLLSQ